MLFYVITMAGGVIVGIFDDGILESFSYEFLIKSLILVIVLVIVVVLFGVVGLMYGLARLLSSFGKPESRWKRYAAVMVPTVSIFSFAILFWILNTAISLMIGIDPLGDYEAPLRHRYTVIVANGYYESMDVCDVLDGRNGVVVDGVNELYMDGNMLYGRCVDESQGCSNGFALDMRSGKCEPVEVDVLRLKSVKAFCEERDRKVTTPLGWLAALISAVVAYFAGRRYFKVIRGTEIPS